MVSAHGGDHPLSFITQCIFRASSHKAGLSPALAVTPRPSFMFPPRPTQQSAALSMCPQNTEQSLPGPFGCVGGVGWSVSVLHTGQWVGGWWFRQLAGGFLTSAMDSRVEGRPQSPGSLHRLGCVARPPGHLPWGGVLGKPHLATCGLGWLLTPCRDRTSLTDKSKINRKSPSWGGGPGSLPDTEQIL